MTQEKNQGKSEDKKPYMPFHRKSLKENLLGMGGLAFCLLVLKFISSGAPENALQWLLIPAGGVALYFLVELALWSEHRYGVKTGPFVGPARVAEIYKNSQTRSEDQENREKQDKP